MGKEEFYLNQSLSENPIVILAGMFFHSSGLFPPLFQLEAVIKSDIPIAMKPSMMAIAVWANAMRLCMSRMQIVSFLQHIDIYCGADQLESSMDTLKF
jgi:hypothetical protein